MGRLKYVWNISEITVLLLQIEAHVQVIGFLFITLVNYFSVGVQRVNVQSQKRLVSDMPEPMLD